MSDVNLSKIAHGKCGGVTVILFVLAKLAKAKS